MINHRRFDFLDVAVAVAIIRVVLAHALNNYFILTTGAHCSFPDMPLWSKLLFVSVKHSVPIFVIVSGFKFANSIARHPEKTYGQFLTDRANRLLRPYLIWTLIFFYLLPVVKGKIPPAHPAYRQFPFPDFSTIWQILNGSINPGYQLWFIPMLLLMIVLYPPVFKAKIPVYITQPFFWILLLVIRFNHLTLPWTFPMYLAFFDLGARFFSYYSHSGFNRRHLLVLFCVSLTASLMSIALQFRFYSMFHGIFTVGAEIAVPISLFLMCALLFPENTPGFMSQSSNLIWPVFILHEPLILGRVAWLTYITLGITHPSAILFVTATAILISILIYQVLKKTKIASYLF